MRARGGKPRSVPPTLWALSRFSRHNSANLPNGFESAIGPRQIAPSRYESKACGVSEVKVRLLGTDRWVVTYVTGYIRSGPHRGGISDIEDPGRVFRVGCQCPFNVELYR